MKEEIIAKGFKIVHETVEGDLVHTYLELYKGKPEVVIIKRINSFSQPSTLPGYTLMRVFKGRYIYFCVMPMQMETLEIINKEAYNFFNKKQVKKDGGIADR